MSSRRSARWRMPAAGAFSAAVLTATMLAPAGALPVTAERLAGADRYATSAAVGAALYTDPSTIYIASGGDYPDALAGAVLTAKDEAPLYLVGESLSDSVRTRLATTSDSDVVILGGEGSVSADVATAIDGVVDDVTRLSGSDRYATSAAISAAGFADGASTVFIASGEVFADALAGAPAAAKSDAPVLLVRRDSISDAVSAELTRLAPENIVVLGGEGTVSGEVAAQLGAWGSVSRLAGADRWETSAAIAASMYPTTSGAAVIASGLDFPDALSAAAPAGLLDAPLLLVATDSVNVAVKDRLEALNPSRVVVVGGSATISDRVLGIVGDPAAYPDSPAAQAALDALASIAVAGDPAPNYDRDRFGNWDSADGCNTRDRVLARDLVNVGYDGDTCDVVSGTLNDPYSGQTIELVTTSNNSSIDIDHIVPLSVAWYYGANTWNDERRNDFYNDMAGLQATGAQVNGSKGNKTISRWLPQESYTCEYVIRYVTINDTWDLAMPQADIDTARAILPGC